MFRITTTTAALATLALALPGTAAAGPLEASASLQAHAVLDASKAASLAKSNGDKAKELIARSEAEMKKAYALTVAQGQSAQGKGLEASAQLSSSAQAQGDKLSAIVDRSKGSLKSAAADALAKTGELQAKLVDRVAKGVKQQDDSASATQAQGISNVGSDNASLTATIVVTASGDGVKPGIRRALERAGEKVRDAHGKLMSAVAELRKRSEGQGQEAMGQTQSSLSKDDCQMNQAFDGSKQADAKFAAQDGDVRVGDKDVDTGTGSGVASATGEAHVSITGSSC